MGRKRDPVRKAELLSAFVDYLMQNGMSDFSLRPAAAAIGTSARMLLYHFGSKERLLVSAIAEIRKREDARFSRGNRRLERGRSIADVAFASWQWFSGSPRERYLRFFFELYGLAAMNPKRFMGLVDRADASYFSIMERGLESWGIGRRERQAVATLYLASFRGLSMDLLTTGDRARINYAAKLLASNLERDMLRLMPSAPDERAESTSDETLGTSEPAENRDRRRAAGTLEEILGQARRLPPRQRRQLVAHLDGLPLREPKRSTKRSVRA